MILLLAALVASQTPPTDAKASDAVAAFEQLCAGMFAGGKSDIDPSRFTVTELPAETVKEVKPDLVNSTVWDVSGKASDMHMLVHYEPSGMCVVEVAEADEITIRTDYLSLVERIAKVMKARPERQADRTNEVQGKAATTSMWRVKGNKRDVMFAITTYPEAKFMIQHLMTVSYVR